MFTKRILTATGILVVLFGMGWIDASRASKEAPRRVLLNEDFEGDGKLQLWMGNGTSTVNYAGPSDEKAASGRCSFKIDVTFGKDSTYNYWQSPVPLMIPFYGRPEVSGKLCIERGNARLGFAWTDPGDRTVGEQGGMVMMGTKVNSLPGGWGDWSCSAEAQPDSRNYASLVLLLIYPDAEGRTVVYIDDLKVEAGLSESYEAEFKAQLEQIVTERKADISKAADALRTQFLALSPQLKASPDELPASVSPSIAECWRQRQEYSRKTQAELESKLAELRTAPSTAVLDSIHPLLRSLERVQASAESYIDNTKSQSGLPWTIWTIEPISDVKILPDKFPLMERLGTQLRVSACPGEYEPTSFALRAPEDKEINGLLAVAGDAKCGDFTIPASAIDIRVVKCWWQAGGNIMEANRPTFTPELLLKDPGFIQVDNVKKQNRLRDPKSPRDSQRLLPVTVPVGTTQQFWVTVHVPEEAPPGTYQGTIDLRVADKLSVSLPLEIEVLPFELEEPRLEYSLYYIGVLTEDDKGSLTNRNKSQAQYLAEMRNMKAHGVTNPQFPQQPGPLVDKVIELRRKAGLINDPLYLGGVAVAGLQVPDDPMQIRPLIKQLAKHGVKDAYIYGIDEVKGGELTAERELVEAAHKLGAKVHQACGTDAIDLIGDLLDLAIVDRLIPGYAEKWHARGKKVFSYCNPQVGEVRPETYRRNYGLALWKAGYDGAMDWAYQHNFGPEIKEGDDSDINGVRMYAFAYPTVDGVIDTIQWEGFREGVDDVRYLTTLLSAIEKAKADPAKQSRAEEAEQWLQTIDVQGQLGTLRIEIIRRIVQLGKE